MVRLLLAALLGILSNPVFPDTRESLQSMVDLGLERAETQALILADNLKENNDALPRTWESMKGPTAFSPDGILPWES